MELFWWLLTVILFALGLIGTVLPVFPGTIIILAGALVHRLMLGPEKSIGWRTIVILLLLTLATYALDFLSGYFGARFFGATRWGMFGAMLGALLGLFFGIVGLFVGPVIGAVLGEFIAGKRMIDAGRAGWGSLLGNLGAVIGKLLIALAMIAIFFLTVPAPFSVRKAGNKMKSGNHESRKEEMVRDHQVRRSPGFLASRFWDL
jgi:uncharacterized protein YqgC (DUF456 family)